MRDFDALSQEERRKLLEETLAAAIRQTGGNTSVAPPAVRKTDSRKE